MENANFGDEQKKVVGDRRRAEEVDGPVPAWLQSREMFSVIIMRSMGRSRMKKVRSVELELFQKNK